MSMSLGGWSVLGIAAAVLIVAGIVLLIAYAVERGLVHRELDGTVAADTAGSVPSVRVPGSSGGARTLGLVGAVLLAVGLVLGLLTAVTGWGGAGFGGLMGPGNGPGDCAQSWNGCPQTTVAP